MRRVWACESCCEIVLFAFVYTDLGRTLGKILTFVCTHVAF